jgi:Flp pilus assembly pilin Flp
MAAILTLCHRFRSCCAGATGGEYAVCIALLVVVAVAAISVLGDWTGGVQELNGAISQQHLGYTLDATLPLDTQTR